jgi:hypothetical protein
VTVFDVECYPNYFMCGFKNIETGKIKIIDGIGIDSRREMKRALMSDTMVGFNSTYYDLPMLESYFDGDSTQELHEKSLSIVEEKKRYYHSLDFVDHIDIDPVAPGKLVGLKLYAARIHSKSLQDLPYDAHKPLSERQKEKVRKYNINDLQNTEDVYNELKPAIRLREKMDYPMDLRSKSDAQIAESVLAYELGVQKEKPPKLSRSYRATYTAPSYIEFEDKQLKDLLEKVQEIEFELDKAGAVKFPKELSGEIFKLGVSKYKIGIGGLHSREKSRTFKSDENNVLMNFDFESYYPNLIVKNRYFPKRFGVRFLSVYKKLLKKRLDAKSKVKMTLEERLKIIFDVINQSLKIVLNSSFGKYGSKWSKLFAPDLMLQVTITGQLILLMLIERLEKRGVTVVSANTDGIEVLVPKRLKKRMFRVVERIERITGQKMEWGEYVSLHSRDVNNYVAKYKDHVKAKGVYSDRKFIPKGPLDKNVQVPVCFKAVRDYIDTGADIEKTIRDMKDVREFTSSRRVDGGGVWNGEYLGKVVRWYYAEGGSPITYHTNGHKVPLTDGSKPMMTLTDEIPKDLNYQWYIDYANRMLKDLG